MSEHPSLSHQFEDLEQQFDAANLGMWVFLVTEIMFFGALFAGYTVYRHQYPVGFDEASRRLDVVLGSINTVILIGSSLSMAMAVYFAQHAKRKALVVCLLLTMVLGTAFLGIKAVEYTHKFHEHLFPGPTFSVEGSQPLGEKVFFSFYFAMTGMHALHMIIGIGIMVVLVIMALRGRFTLEYNTPIEIFGLYWHFVDIVWIFLFPLLYLIDRH